MPHSASCLKKLYTNYVSYYKLLKTCGNQKTGKVQTVKTKGVESSFLTIPKFSRLQIRHPAAGWTIYTSTTRNTVGPDAWAPHSPTRTPVGGCCCAGCCQARWEQFRFLSCPRTLPTVGCQDSNPLPSEPQPPSAEDCCLKNQNVMLWGELTAYTLKKKL